MDFEVDGLVTNVPNIYEQKKQDFELNLACNQLKAEEDRLEMNMYCIYAAFSFYFLPYLAAYLKLYSENNLTPADFAWPLLTTSVSVLIPALIRRSFILSNHRKAQEKVLLLLSKTI